MREAGGARTPDVPTQQRALPPYLSCRLAPAFRSGKVPRSEALRYTVKGRKSQEETIKHWKSTK